MRRLIGRDDSPLFLIVILLTPGAMLISFFSALAV